MNINDSLKNLGLARKVLTSKSTSALLWEKCRILARVPAALGGWWMGRKKTRLASKWLNQKEYGLRGAKKENES